MDLERFLCASNVVIVAGKGGVGKTTVSATLALVAARRGMRVLIVEVEGKSGISSMFGKPELGYDVSELAPNIQARTLTPERALLEYLETHGMRRIAKRLVSSGAADVISTAAPGIKDILVLGKVKSMEKGGEADLIVIDAPAAGHAITFLTSPAGLLDSVRVGPNRKQATDVIELLSDPKRCRVLLVTLAEETPVNEVTETAYALEDRVGVSLLPVVVNSLYEPLFPASVPDGWAAPSITPDMVRTDGETAGVFVSEREADDLAEAATFREGRRALQQDQVRRLAASLPLQQIALPFVPRTEFGPAELEALAATFSTGVEALRGEP